jgi:CubicO group peptidase (beta-lactamase class C family)
VDADRVLFEHHAGWADLGRRVSMDASTTMMAYSMSKPITAAAVLLLVEEGRIGLDAPITDFLTAIPYRPQISVRQLLSHTSGIPNPIPLRWVHPAAAHATFDEAAALAAVLARHGRLASPPGARYAYSNIGYWLLGGIIERASGESFTSFTATRVLEPLGLTAESLGYTIPDPARHAAGYLEKYSFINLIKGFVIDSALIGDYTGEWLSIGSHYVNGPAFGGLVGTARAFGRFLQDQLARQSRILGDATRELFYERQRTASGTLLDMTLGWHCGALGSTEHFYKEGGGGGFHCMMRLYRSRGIGTLLMVNATQFDVRKCLDTLDAGFMR